MPRFLKLFTHVLGALTITATLGAQLPAPANALAPPVLPLLVSYRYWPVQYVQWTGTEVPYSMVLFSTDTTDAKHPLLDFALTLRSDNSRVHYTNNDAVLAAAKAAGEEAYKVPMAFDAPDNDTNNGSTTAVRFTMKDGKPLQFRFVQGSDMSEQGSGLTAMPGIKIPIFAYRELGAVAGAGTALQIGDTASPAAVWSEISQPPYFVAYHGAVTESAHTLVFAPGQNTWTVAAAPTALAPGATWTLDEAKGDHRVVRVDKVSGDQVTLRCTDSTQPGTETIIEAAHTGDVWAIDSVRFQPAHNGDRHALTLTFAKPLSPEVASDKLTLVVGKKSALATGALTGSVDHGMTLTFDDPKWLAGVPMQENVASSASGITVTAHP